MSVLVYPVSDLVSIYSIYRTALTTSPRVAWDRATLWGGSWLADRHDMPSTSGALTLHVTITLHATITALYRHGITCFNWQYSDAWAFIKLDHTNPIIIIPFSQFITGLDVLHIIFYSDWNIYNIYIEPVNDVTQQCKNLSSRILSDRVSWRYLTCCCLELGSG